MRVTNRIYGQHYNIVQQQLKLNIHQPSSIHIEIKCAIIWLTKRKRKKN